MTQKQVKKKSTAFENAMNQKGQRIWLWKTINQYIAMIALD